MSQNRRRLVFIFNMNNSLFLVNVPLSLIVKSDVQCMFDRTQTGCSSQHKIQVNSCISQHDFLIPQYVSISFVNCMVMWGGKNPHVGIRVQNQRSIYSLSSPFCYRKGDLFQGLRVGSCPTLGNELSEESHMLRKQESLLRRDAWEESRRVRETRRTAAPCGSQSWVLW